MGIESFCIRSYDDSTLFSPSRCKIQSTQESDNQERVSKLRVQNRSLLAENYRLKDDKEQLLNLVEKLEGKIATFDQAKSSSMNVDEK